MRHSKTLGYRGPPEIHETRKRGQSEKKLGYPEIPGNYDTQKKRDIRKIKPHIRSFGRTFVVIHRPRSAVILMPTFKIKKQIQNNIKAHIQNHVRTVSNHSKNVIQKKMGDMNKSATHSESRLHIRGHINAHIRSHATTFVIISVDRATRPGWGGKPERRKNSVLMSWCRYRVKLSHIYHSRDITHIVLYLIIKKPCKN